MLVSSVDNKNFFKNFEQVELHWIVMWKMAPELGRTSES